LFRAWRAVLLLLSALAAGRGRRTDDDATRPPGPRCRASASRPS